MGSLHVSRYEFKYVVHPDELPEIGRYILRYCAEDSHAVGGAWYKILSLYLDNDTYQLYRDTEAGAPWRVKLRARSYGAGNGDIKLEVKRRSKDLSQKTSAVVTPGEMERIRQEGLFALAGGSSPYLASFIQMAESVGAAPKMLVEYERRAFFSVVDDYVRLTFDRRMRCQSRTTWDLRPDERAWTCVDDPGSIGERKSGHVMEIKFVASPPAWIHDMVTTFGLVRRGFSKYGRAVRRTCNEEEAAWDLRPRKAVFRWLGQRGRVA